MRSATGPDLRLDGQRPRADQLEHRGAVRAQPEEVVALPRADQLEGGVLDAVPVDDLGLGLELLAARAVQPFVVRHEQVAGPALLMALLQRGDAAGSPRLIVEVTAIVSPVLVS